MVPVFLGLHVTGENGAGWVAFFRDLAARGCREDARAPGVRSTSLSRRRLAPA
jgi:hypothetical protein